MIYLFAFLICGVICGLAQVIKDIFKLTIGHMTVLFVCLGTLLDFANIYDKLIELAGAGAILPITSFGHLLVEASLEGAKKDGFIGLFTGLYSKTSGGIALTILLSVIIALIFRPKK